MKKIAVVIALVLVMAVSGTVFIFREQSLLEAVDSVELVESDVKMLFTTSFDLTEEENAAICELLSSVTVRRDVFEQRYSPEGREYQLNVSGDKFNYSVTDLRIAENGDCLMYLRGKDNKFRCYNDVSFETKDELLALLAQVTQPDPPTDEELAPWLESMISAGLHSIPNTTSPKVTGDMYISRAIFPVNAMTDSHTGYTYFIFDKNGVYSRFDLGVDKKTNGHHLITTENVAAAFDRILENDLSFAIVSGIDSGEYPEEVLCPEDGEAIILYPAPYIGDSIKIDDEISGLTNFKMVQLELRPIAEIINRNYTGG